MGGSIPRREEDNPERGAKTFLPARKGHAGTAFALQRALLFIIEKVNALALTRRRLKLAPVCSNVKFDIFSL
jgi:hypothetical protein